MVKVKEKWLVIHSRQVGYINEVHKVMVQISLASFLCVTFDPHELLFKLKGNLQHDTVCVCVL